MAGKVLVIKGADFSSVAVEQVTIIDPSAPTYRLTVTSADTNMGTVTGGGMYTEGANVTIKATANNGYKFVRWNDGNTNATRTVTMGDSDVAYTATFAVNDTISSANLGYVASSGNTRSLIMIHFLDTTDWKFGFTVKADSPYKFAIHLNSNNEDAVATAMGATSPEEPGIIGGYAKDSGWKTSGQSIAWDDSDTDVSTLGGKFLAIQATDKTAGTGMPTAENWNQWLQFDYMDNVIIKVLR